MGEEGLVGYRLEGLVGIGWKELFPRAVFVVHYFAMAALTRLCTSIASDELVRGIRGDGRPAE